MVKLRSGCVACRAAAVAALLAFAFVGACDGSGGTRVDIDFDLPAVSVDFPEPGPAGSPYDVVIVSLDTLRADHVSAYGYARPTSPQLDAFASGAVVFENAYAHAPYTAPSHMSLFTSLYPGDHGIRNLEQGDPRRLDPDIPPLAAMLRGAGYSTRAVVAGGNVTASLGFDVGFDAYEEIPNSLSRLFDRAKEVLGELAGSPEPYLLFVHTYEIHDPYVSPPEFVQLFADPGYAGEMLATDDALAKRAGSDFHARHSAYWDAFDRESEADREHLVALYDAGIRYTDLHLGGFLAAVDDAAEGRETVVVVLSDHGEEFGEHGRYRHVQLYDEVLRVPLIVRLPAGPAGHRVPTRVRLVDVVPTLLDLLELEAPGHLRGESLLPLIGSGGEGSEDRPVLAQFEYKELASLHAGAWKVVRRPRHTGRRSLSWGDWALHLERTRDASELYRIDRDPAEGVDLARSEVEQLEAMLAALPLPGEGVDETSGAAITVDDEMRRQLEELGYVDEP